ncbi:hypothetical protein [Hyalangium sp.]|nr:hypothetical protein [Hyalangium sp.]HYH98674.1 hypothetical protein [Hyalangium sp.]
MTMVLAAALALSANQDGVLDAYATLTGRTWTGSSLPGARYP